MYTSSQLSDLLLSTRPSCSKSQPAAVSCHRNGRRLAARLRRRPSWVRLIAGQSGLRAPSDNVGADLPARWSAMFQASTPTRKSGFDPDRAVRARTSADGPLHPVRAGRRQAVARASWAPEDEAVPAHRHHHRLRRRLFPPSSTRCAQINERACASRHSPSQAFWSAGRRPNFDPLWLQGPARRPGHRLRRRRRRSATPPASSGRRSRVAVCGGAEAHRPCQPRRLASRRSTGFNIPRPRLAPFDRIATAS